MHAIITGATGATGKDLLHLLLKDNSVKQVDIFVRRNPGVEHEKLNTHIIDFDKSLGLFKSVRPLPTDLLAMAMLNAVKSLGNGEYAIIGQDIRKYAENQAGGPVSQHMQKQHDS